MYQQAISSFAFVFILNDEIWEIYFISESFFNILNVRILVISVLMIFLRYYNYCYIIFQILTKEWRRET